MSIIDKIKELKTKRNAVIMAHNYVSGEVQDIADVTGDSLELARQAAKLSAPVVVLAGVSFMAETAKIMCPDAIVLHPVPQAGCPMAAMAPAEKVAEYRRLHPDTVLVAYVNTTAATKAEVDICCTSSNAEQIIASIPSDQEIMFLPDRNLGANVSHKLGRKMHLWDGCCPIHDRITVAEVTAVKTAHPSAVMLTHPECRPEIVSLADYAMSTGWMLKKVQELPNQEIIVGTEFGVAHRMQKENPQKTFIPLQPLPTCTDMKLITLESIANCLENMSGEVKLSPDLCRRARLPIERMLAGHL